MKQLFVLLLFLTTSCSDTSTPTKPFGYDLHLHTIPGTSDRTMVCCHGYGGSYQIADRIKNLNLIDATLVSFNFPDHDIVHGSWKPRGVSFGTINELLPVLYVLKEHVIDHGLDAIDLYGFSAGGGAVVNVLATLNSDRFDSSLQQIGIGPYEKQKLLEAIQNGVVILDAPFKSMEEISDIRGKTLETEIVARQFNDNQMRPIDSLMRLQGLSLNVILHFEQHDEIIFNRDDPIYTERLMQANSLGTTSVLVTDDGGHNAPHLSLWHYYREKIDLIADS